MLLEELFEHRVLVGKSRNEGLGILGKPGQRDLDAESYFYRIGPENAYMKIDDEWLVLHFRKDRVVSQNLQSD